MECAVSKPTEWIRMECCSAGLLAHHPKVSATFGVRRTRDERPTIRRNVECGPLLDNSQLFLRSQKSGACRFEIWPPTTACEVPPCWSARGNLKVQNIRSYGLANETKTLTGLSSVERDLLLKNLRLSLSRSIGPSRKNLLRTMTCGVLPCRLLVHNPKVKSALDMR
jgi:hypothetical protein